MSPDFAYFGPGQIIPGTGVRGNSGRDDYTVYAKIRFPLASAPAYANSQSFMNWGDCDHTGRAPAVNTKDAAYRCRVNDRPLVFDEAKNYAYPWRDNFCEHRWFFVKECPGGWMRVVPHAPPPTTQPQSTPPSAPLSKPQTASRS